MPPERACCRVSAATVNSRIDSPESVGIRTVTCHRFTARLGAFCDGGAD